MRKGTDMAPDMTGTYVWTAIFIVAGCLFWGVASWAVVRGGKDIIDIITSEREKSRKHAKG